MHTITPRIVVDDVDAMVELLRHVFGATGEVHGDRPAMMRIGDSIVMVSGTGPRPATPAFLYVYVEDADATYRRAIAAGARSLEEPVDTSYGDRRAMVADRFGNVWQIATRASIDYGLRPVGWIRSDLHDREVAPKQGFEGAPDAWLEIEPAYAEAASGLGVGDAIIVITWLHEADRETQKVHPRSDERQPLTGVFATRSPDRPNPIGLHRVTVRELGRPRRLRVGPLEAIDGTPLIDLKPPLDGPSDG